MQEFFEAAAGRTQIIQLVDAKVGATPLDVQAVDYLASLGISPIVVATKIDRVPRGRRQAMFAKLREQLAFDGGQRLIGFSARSGEGAKELWTEIRQYLDLTRRRHGGTSP